MKLNKNVEINSYIWGQLIYDKNLRIYNREKTVSLINGAEKLDSYMHKIETEQLSYTIQISNSKWIK